ncbi:MAG: hypothetical protein FWD19_00845 [Defluviitaleaceae bacterium]|nr:hypothetical protein [Defluviitaleaceae bacterium]
MKKILPLAKSFFILSLAALAVFQVNQLWLVNLTNRNFFIYLQARFAPAAPDGQNAFARPFRIISGAGDGHFRVRYSEIAGSDEWFFCEEILQTLLRRDANFSAEKISATSEIFSQPVVVCEYAFSMSAEIFTRALGGQGTLLADNGIENFRKIFFLPNEKNIFFVNEHEVFKFSLAQTDFSMHIEPANPSRLHFVQVADGFVPRAPGNVFSYRTIVAENPFRNPQGLFTRSHIRSMVETFFDNPAAIIPGISVDGIYTFSTRNAMVRYLENSVLEYTSYRTIGRTAPENFMADFSAALDFVNNDPTVVNEIFLRAHESRHGRAHVFWFDYVIDNRPIVLVEEWRTGARCTEPLLAPIEVVVDHGRVVRYRRIAYTFSSEGAISWKNLPVSNENFTLGFPVDPSPKSSGTVIELAVIY